MGPLDPEERVSATLVVRPRPDGPPLPDFAYWQKTPPGHRRFLSANEFARNHGAAPSDLELVAKFAAGAGLTIVKSNAAARAVVVSGTAQQVNAAFGIRLEWYDAPAPPPRRRAQQQQPAPQRQRHRGFTGPVHLPAPLIGVVTAVFGLDNRLRGTSNDGDPPNTNTLTVPEVAQLYNIPNTGAGGQTIGIFCGGGTSSNYDPKDVTNYFTSLPAGYTTAPTIVNIPLTVDGTTYQNNPSGPLDPEITQDIEIAATVAQGATINVYSSIDTEDGWLAYLNEIIASDPPPSVLTSSWYLGHDDSDEAAVLDALTVKFQELATRGITVFNAQGDSGSNDDDGVVTCRVQYPASDPWVTSCGGTTIGNISGSSFDEWVWNDDTGATGGGVSDFFAVPFYQTAAGLAPTSKNDGMVRRGVPDVAANASANSGYSNLIMGGAPFTGRGTSAVAPLWAGLIAVLNQALGESIGFLNPTIYLLGESVFRDITNGDNNPNDGTGAPYYTAGPNWDPCTGWGSPNGQELLAALTSIYTQNFYFIVDKNTFGTDEVKDVIASAAAGRFSNAFWLVLEGFTPNGVASAIPTFAPASTFNSTNITGLSVSADTITPVAYELGGPGSAYADVVQRIRFAYDITFTGTASFPAIGSEQVYTLLANITLGGTTLSLQPEALFELVGGSNPYFTNVDSGNPNAVFYLSQDLRVFTVTAGQSPVFGAPTFTSDPYGSIQSLLYYLNNTPLYTQPYSGSDPLNSLPNQTGYETGDTSVTPLSGGQQNYNFAIARVRLQGATGTTSPNVRVFFRLWVAVSFDTDFDPDTTYPSQLGTNASSPDYGLPIFPLASGTGLVDPSGQSLQTIPFFATDSTGSNDYNPAYLPPNEDNNIQTITIPAGQDSAFTYFGCFLDVYNASNQSKFPGSHHCIVAQIAYDGAPIPTMTPSGSTIGPENWDQLAQRNLQITSSGQPGFPVTHQIPQTFDTRPSPLPIFAPGGQLLNYPDELMVDWGDTPVGSVARVYWPQVSSAEVLKTASRLYPTNQLSAIDSHTIQCTVLGAVTYIPVPTGPGQNFAGLFTVDLPAGIRVGSEFNITVRRLTSGQSFLNDTLAAMPAGRNGQQTFYFRRVAGTFQVKIPVSLEARLLLPEENLLAILKWRLENMSGAYRWYPVLQRYISIVSARVKGMGGDPSAIAPSQYGVPAGGVPGGGRPHREAVEFTGKVSAIIYDRFGDFDGFSLLTEGGQEHSFRAREHEVEKIVNRAWTERILISVFVEHGNHRVPMSIVLRRAPWPYNH